MARHLLGFCSVLLFAAVPTGCDDEAATPTTCDQAASAGVRQCVADYSAAIRTCYQTDGTPCDTDAAGLASALGDLRAGLTAHCTDGAFGGFTVDAVVARLENACSSEAEALAWRTFGGPQGAVFDSGDAASAACLLTAHTAGTTLVDGSLALLGDCLTAGTCDATKITVARQTLADAARTAITSACQNTQLETLISLGPDVYVERAAHQTDCLTAMAHAETGTLPLTCGPSNTDFVGKRGEYVQVTVDGDKWGTLCGDGSPYAFQVRLAPEGAPLDRVIVGLQGGGVCAFEADCKARMASNPELFMATDDEALGFGIASDDPAESPFADWTKVYLPYCNQDVFAGGGVDEVLGELTLPRYGSINMRAAVQMVRDVLWKEMDAAGGAGFRPDEVVALFGGWSAGGYGALYNYHWFLDDLQWPRTAAFPDAGLALDNGQTLGVKGLGILKIPGWGMRKNLPPYCFSADCAIGPNLYEALSPRLKRVPEQQMLILSNPRDQTQQGDAFFSNDTPADEAFWINTFRQSYCDTRDLPGINYYFTSVSDMSVHVVSLRPEHWSGTVDGERMRDWFERAVTMPDTIENRVEEADFITDIPGTEAYPCAVAP
ncbi:MAG: hypothetical protein ACI9MR_000248 [Myxococcota bacterium]|jgi:hypothetical protein